MKRYTIAALQCLSVSVGISLLILAGTNFARGASINLTMLVIIPVGVLLIHLGYLK